MAPDYEFFGFAIVSREGMIADAERVMPQTLRLKADHVFFDNALQSMDLIVHGRQSYEGHEDSPHRRRFWLTRSVPNLAPAPEGGRQWLWNPEGLGIEDACRAIGLTGARIAVLGGTTVYDLFLPRYTAFCVSRAGLTSIPVGTPVFSEVSTHSGPGEVLQRHGLVAEPAVTLDAAQELTMTRWRRP